MKKNETSENYINSIVSVLTGHIFTKSNVLKIVNLGINQDFSNQAQDLDPKLEKKINAEGSQLLEKILDENDIKKYIKEFKDNASSFNPSPTTSGENIHNLENSLLNIFSFLKMDKFKNLLMTPEMLEALRSLIKKELAFIEAFKRDKNNEKNNRYEEIINCSKNRLQMQIGILKQIGDNCRNSYEIVKGEEVKKPLLTTFKEVSGLISEIFDKSSDSENLNDLLLYIKDCAGFILENEQELNKIKIEAKKGVLGGMLNVFQEKKFDNVKFEDSVIEKLTNTLMNLLRKNLDDDEICENSKFLY